MVYVNGSGLGLGFMVYGLGLWFTVYGWWLMI
jgi:hypothetical protein